MADNSDTIVLNDYGKLQLEQRVRKSGKVYATVSMKGEPIVANLNPLELGRPVANAIAEQIREQTLAIDVQAAPSTIEKRERAAKAFAAGKKWARERYSGGRMGAMAPNQSTKLFNDSQRFAKSIVVNQNPKEGTWTIDTAANRMRREEFGKGFDAMVRRWIRLVPVLENPWENVVVRRTVFEGYREMIRVAKEAGTLNTLRNITSVLQFVNRVLT